MKTFKEILEAKSKKNDPYAKGYRAAVSGVEHKQNPYDKGGKAYKDWEKGHSEGIRDNEE